jgi:hypothetical protein
MAALTTRRRNNLADSKFALPGRRYPIDTANRARNALARASQHASKSEQCTIARKVARRWPSIEVDKSACS